MSQVSNDGMEYFDYKEQIHEIGYVQDQGYLLTVKRMDNQWKVTATSENIVKANWLNITDARSLLNKSISEVFDPLSSYAITSMIERSSHEALINYTTNASQAKNFQLLRMKCPDESEELLCCSTVVCSNNKTFILEFECVDDVKNIITIPNNRILQSGELVGRVRSCDSIETVTATFCDCVMEVIRGYDRGMVYRFGDDGSGDVIYEKVREGSSVASSYLNLRFPAEDIPPQARAIYVKTGIRFIYDVDGTDSKLISSDGDAVDLTMSSMRAVSKCHLQYLRNMGVVSSLAIAITVAGSLWGLYTFHSYSKPTKPNVEERIVLEMVGAITSMRIHSYIHEINSNRKLELGKIMLSLPTMKNVHEFLQIYHQTILNIVDAHAIILFHDQVNYTVFGDSGIVPTEDGINKLFSMSQSNILLTLHSFSDGLNNNGAGILFYNHQYVTIAFIRRSKVCDVRWGGNPDVPRDPKSVERLQPRSSFLLYIEKGRTESRVWTAVDTELAQFAIDRITQYLHTELLSSFRLSLDQSNSECLDAIRAAKENYEFFAHMSHELRTPFHGVMSSLQILNSGGTNIPETERKEIIESALECGKTMLRTLDDILTIAKSKNMADVSNLPFSIYRVVVGTKKMMKPIAEHKLITFDSRIGALNISGHEITEAEFRNLTLVGDETRIGQIANNLTNNAIKFTPTNGCVRTTAHLMSSLDEVRSLWKAEIVRFQHNYMANTDIAKLSDTSPKVFNSHNVIHNLVSPKASGASSSSSSSLTDVWFVFQVEDTGCGVHGDDLKAMFEAYRQLSSGATKTYQGTGLGLHICKLHSDSMNGIFGVASTEGKGTMFMFAIPMQKVDKKLQNLEEENSMDVVLDSLANVPNLSSVATVPVHKSVPGATFLVVDDSVVNLRLTKRKIELALGDDIIVRTAVDGLEGIAAYETLIEEGKQPMLKCIFMDYHMPKCSGIEAIMKIRSIEANHADLSPCHIVAFTADLSEKSSREVFLAGANEVLAKPTPTGQLEEICARLASV